MFEVFYFCGGIGLLPQSLSAALVSPKWQMAQFSLVSGQWVVEFTASVHQGKSYFLL